jgi:hypothetical protein
MPQMLREIVQDSLAQLGGVSFAGSYATAAEVVPAIDRLAGQRYVLIGTNGLAAETIRELLCRHPRAKLLVLEDDGRDTVVYELRPHRQALGTISPQTLAAAVRETAV